MARRWMDLTPQRVVVVAVVPVTVFVAVTWGLRPTVNFIARRSSSSGTYGQYGFSGTWKLGLLVAAVSLAVVVGLFRRQARGR